MRRFSFLTAVLLLPLAGSCVAAECKDASSCYAAGVSADRSGEWAEAIASYTKAIELGEASAEIYNRRGIVRFMAARIDESIEDFDRAISLEPRLEPHHWQRGIALYYAGRFDDCRRQFELHKKVNPNDVENSAWHFLCVARLEGPEAAREKLIPVSGDPRRPMAEVLELFAGRATPADVLAASPDPDALFYARLYLCLYYEALGDEETAGEHLDKAVDGYPGRHYMWQVARIHRELRGAR